MGAYTLVDLEAARAKLTHWQDRQANATANNPDKHQGKINEAWQLVRQIEEELKRTGVIALTPQEQLERVLDSVYPQARSKEIVTHEGKKYQRVFYPLKKSRTGKTVTDWGKEWKLLEE